VHDCDSFDYIVVGAGSAGCVNEATAQFAALGDGLTFLTPPLERETELTGPLAAKLFVSSTTTDADLFLIVQVFALDGKEAVFQGALDPHTPVAQAGCEHRTASSIRCGPRYTSLGTRMTKSSL
jgi:predicted acyl esterase